MPELWERYPQHDKYLIDLADDDRFFKKAITSCAPVIQDGLEIGSA
jgi:hypothetical protein